MADTHHTRGAILILTLWVIALLSLMANGVILQARLGVREARWADLELQGRHLMRGLNALAVDRLAQDDSLDLDAYREPWGRAYAADSVAILADFAGAAEPGEPFELELRPVDEAGKVNINIANQDLLVAVLREYGVGPNAADIARAIADWRDDDDIGPAERDLYQSSNPPYAPSDADFKSIDELLFVYGIDSAMFFGEDANRNGFLDPNEDDGDVQWPPDNMDGQLQPGLVEAFTVYGGDGAIAININTCPPQVLHAVLRLQAPMDAAADGWADSLLAKRQGPDRIDGTEDDVPFESEDQVVAMLAQVMGEEDPALALQAASPFVVASDFFRFYAWVRFPEKHYALAAETVVKREDGRLIMLEYHDGE